MWTPWERPARPAALLLIVCSLLAGCAEPELAGRQTTRGIVSGAAEGLADLDPAVLQKLRKMYLGDADIQRSARALSKALVLGTSEGLQQAQLDQLAGRAVAATLTALRTQGGPVMEEMVRSQGAVISAALQRGIRDSILTAGLAMRQTTERDLAAAAQVLIRAALGATMTTLAQYLQGIDLDARTERYARETLAPAAGLVMRTAMREAMLGMQEGIDLTEKARPRQAPLRTVMREIGAGLAEGMGAGVSNTRLTKFLTAGIGVLVLLLIGALVGAILLWKRYQRTTRSLLTFARKLNEAREHDDTTLRSLREAIQAAHVENRQDAWLTRFLTRSGLTGTGNPDKSKGAGGGPPGDIH